MGNLAFDREVINYREKPLSSDLNYAATYADRAVRSMLWTIYGARQVGMSGIADRTAFTTGIAQFLGDGYKVRPSAAPDFNVVITPGLGFYVDPADVPTAIGGITGVDDLEQLKPLALSQAVTIAIAAPPAAGNGRIDIIEVKTDRRLTDSTVREAMNGAGVFVPGAVYKTLTFDHFGRSGSNGVGDSTTGIGYKLGTVAALDAETTPATTAGYTKIAEIYVKAGAASLDTDVIADHRYMAFPFGCGQVSGIVENVYTAAAGGSFKCSLTNIVAPPGVSIVGYGATYGSALFIAAGAGLGSAYTSPSLGAMAAVIPISFTTGESDTVASTTFVVWGYFANRMDNSEAYHNKQSSALWANPISNLAWRPSGAGAGVGFYGQKVMLASALCVVPSTLVALALADGDYATFGFSANLGR